MKPSEKKMLLQLYESRYDQYGYDVRSVGWGNVKSQNLRFKILADIADLSGCCICDLGCGFGDLYSYLMRRFGHVDYTGIDLSGKLIEEAKRRYPTASFEVRDILADSLERKFDYVLASGALSFKMADHELYVEKMLVKMMELSRKGIAVNFLSSYVDYQLDKNFHFSPEAAFSTAKKITKYVALRSDYPLYEFTLYLYHQALS